jgi:hypothetical protein
MYAIVARLPARHIARHGGTAVPRAMKSKTWWTRSVLVMACAAVVVFGLAMAKGRAAGDPALPLVGSCIGAAFLWGFGSFLRSANERKLRR